MQSFDLELALVNLTTTNADKVSRFLPSDYSIENRTSKGWGYVLSLQEDRLTGDLDHQIRTFLGGLAPVGEWIKISSSILRVAIFNEKYTCTIGLSEFDKLIALNLKLEVTVYPCESD